ncbi:MAG: metallophosphoesterase [Propionibacteriaceae bacterium]
MSRHAPNTLVRLVAAATLTAGLALTASSTAQAAPTVCDTMTVPITHVVNPGNQSALLTRWPTEAAKAASGAYTEPHGTPFRAAVAAGTGLVKVHRLYRKANADFVWMHQTAQIANAVKSLGYVDQGTGFYASAVAAPCTVKVERFLKSGMHRFAVSSAERSALSAAGWTSEGAGFYAAATSSTPPAAPAPAPAPPTGDTKFSIAVYPDTQQEVLVASDHRFIDRSKWLVANRSSLDLRFVTHTGDVVNWDTANHSQTRVASEAMKPLEAAKIPYSMTIGNHDTQATGVGGGARDPKRTRVLQRDTHVFNSFFTAARYGAVKGAYETNKVDNIYSTFEAGGSRWMVINLELWPRTAVVDWAKKAVATHPDYNVIIATHNYLNGDGSISTAKDYGDNSGRYLFDNLVKVYPNVKIVLSGHVGRYGSRIDTGVHGNKIVSYLQTFHSNTTNPVRLMEIDTAKGTVSSRVYAPKTNQTLVASTGLGGMVWIKP